jgi:hypothetical protein
VALLWRASGAPRGSGFATPVRDGAALLPLLVALGAMSLFALSSRAYLGDVKIATMATFYSYLEPIPQAFRASGRFTWPLHYAVILGSIVLIARAIGRPAIVAVVLALAIALQGWDAWSAYNRYDLHFEGRQYRWNPLRQLAWLEMGKSYREVRLVPPYAHDALCTDNPWPAFAYQPFAYLASVEKMSINSGHLSRQPRPAIEAACRSVREQAEGGVLSPDAVYVVGDPFAEAFLRLPREAAVCGHLDGFLVCVRGDRATSLREALAAAG